MSIGMRDSNEHMIAGIIGIIPHKVAVLIILSTLTLEINRISRFVHITIFSAALPVGILISIGMVFISLGEDQSSDQSGFSADRHRLKKIVKRSFKAARRSLCMLTRSTWMWCSVLCCSTRNASRFIRRRMDCSKGIVLICSSVVYSLCRKVHPK